VSWVQQEAIVVVVVVVPGAAGYGGVSILEQQQLLLLLHRVHDPAQGYFLSAATCVQLSPTLTNHISPIVLNPKISSN
jgi:hypothetical protein